MQLKQEVEIESIEQLFKKQTSKQLLIEAFKLILPKKKSWLSFVIVFGVCLLPSILISTSSNTINLTYNVVDKINDVILALFGIIFTGYAFFQALINKKFLIWMLGYENNNLQNNDKKIQKTRLQNTNEYFVQVMLLQGFSIFISVFLIITLGAFSEDWCISKNNLFNEIFAFSLLQCYLVFNFLIIWELKSFVFNIFQLFNAHAGATVLALFDDNQDE